MKKRTGWLKGIFPACIVMAVFAVSIFYYLRDIRDSLWEQAISNVLEVTSQGGHAFEIYIEKDMQILDRIEKHLVMEKSDDESAIIECIDSFEESEAHFTVISEKRAVMYSNEGKTARKIDKDEMAIYEGFADRGVREPYMDEYMEEKVIGGYKRFMFDDGTEGIVEIKRPLAVVAEEFMLSFYNDAGFSFIVNKDGDILTQSTHKETVTYSNILETVGTSGNGRDETREFKDSMANEGSGVREFVFDGEDHVLAFTPVDGTDGWYLVAIVPNAVIMKHSNEILKNSRTFMFLFGGILFIGAAFVYMGRKSQKQIMEKEGDVQYREQLFSILANNTDDIFLTFTTDDMAVEYVSPNVERILGISPDEVKANIRVLERVLADDGENIDYNSVKNLKLGGSVSHEGERIHRKKGDRRWFVETIFKRSVNDSERFVAVMSDRTRERRSEEALKDALEIAKRANESKSTFLSNMSHDIRTPMNAIVGFSALLQRDCHNPEKVREYTAKIVSSSQHLLGLINDVLDMSKIESGKTTLNISEFSLAEIVDELRTMMMPQAKAKKQSFEIFVYDICNEEVLGDRLRINQILINIISNALKYTPVGGNVEMTVRQLEQRTKNYAHFRFVISDNGIGMSKEYIENIFHPFSRENTAKTAEIQGTGLGMAITKNLVDLMGGTIEVKSEPDKGSVFTLDIGLRIKEQDTDPNFWKKHGVTNLLVVDDEEEICAGISNAMTDTGVNVSSAGRGLAAVQMAERAEAQGQGYDLILIDWQMPDINGIETARRIRKIVPARVPVMILTAYDIDRIEEEGADAGVDGFLQKPFFLSNFKLLIDNLKEEGGAKEPAAEQDDLLEGKHILAAEDNELNAEILLELLEMTGAICNIVGNGKEALDEFKQSKPGEYDLILMDIQMPVMNGYEATRAIRKCGHPQAETVPIIAMTANAFSEDVKDARNAGMDEHVAKPLDMEHLKKVIREMLNPQKGNK